MRFVVPVTFVVLVGLVPVGCGTDAASDVVETQPQDVRPDAPDLVNVPEAGGPDLDVLETEIDDPVAPDTDDTTPPPVGPYVVACEADADCRVACGQGSCDPAARRCVFVPKPGRCVLPVPGEVELVDCFDASAVNPALGCLFCQPAVAQDRWSAAAWFDDLEQAGALTVADATSSGVAWHRSSRRSSSGAWSLYLGTDAGDYHAAAPVDSTASLSLHVPGAAQAMFRFDLWMETEGTPGFDLLTVTLDEPEGSHVLFTSDSLHGNTGGEFARIELDVSAWAGHDVSVRLRFETFDTKINQFEGLYVDRLGLWTGCCGSNAECDDLDPCTKEHCRADSSGCDRSALTGCCSTAVDCDDDDPCTLDSCPVPGEGCRHEPVADCCASAADCDDSEPCTEDTCPVPGDACVHVRTCCAKSGECVDDDPCTEGLCQAGACRYVDVCCHADPDCDDGELCTRDRCQANGSCTHEPAHLPGCCIPEIYSEDFDVDQGGFELSGGTGNIGWHRVTDLRAKSAPGALYYGDPATGTYGDDSGWDDWYEDYSYGNAGDATGPAILLPPGVEVTLRFALWIEAEGCCDHLTVFIDDGTGEFEVWTSSSSTVQASWTSLAIDLSALAGRQVRVRLHFSADSSVSYEGAYVDDLRVDTSCGPRLCDADADCPAWGACYDGTCSNGVCVFGNSCCVVAADCDDGDVCTADGCLDGQCGHVREPGCCTSAGDCNDGNPCTTDGCPGEGLQCSHEAVPGCCLSDGECTDGDACTFDWCRQNACRHAPSCCSGPADCDDGDAACTIDTCVDGTCSYAPSWLPECCYPEPYVEPFDGGGGYTLEGGNGPIGWHVVSGLPPAPDDTVLYFGDPEAFSYESYSSNDGSALSPPFLLPPGSDLRLSFELWQHTEGSYVWDFTEVYVRFAGHDVRVWAKTSDTPQQEWTHVEVDVSAFGGLEVRLRFTFEADSIVSYEGVMIDDVRVTSSCSPKACSTAADCPAPAGCFTSTCNAGTCVYAKLCCATATDCDDGDPCTADACSAGSCLHVVDEACCKTAADCDDNEVCTDDTCPVPGGACVHAWSSACCHIDGHCDDADACTLDRCVDDACLHADTCCEPDLVLRSLGEGGCDDGDPCTTEACTDGRCKIDPSGMEGCCQPDLLADTFTVALPAWSFVERVGSLGWSVVHDGPLVDDGGALYFGDPATWSYDTGTHEAESAELSGVELYPGMPWRLSFRVNADVGDPGDAFDRLRVEVVDGDKRVLVWTKDDLNGLEAWQTASADISAFAGRTVGLVFRFDSVDDLNNVGAGVALDDVAVTSPCLPRPCSGPALCKDGLQASKDLCVAGWCAYELP